jgi:acetylornithine aminotransferase
MLGLELDRPAADVVDRAREAGLLVNGTAERVVRLLPPFVLTDAEARQGLEILRRALVEAFQERKFGPGEMAAPAA